MVVAKPMLPHSYLPPREFIIPALFPPPGVTPDFKNPESRGSQVVITSVICLTLMTSFVCMRFYTKFYIKRIVTWDDYLCLPAAVGAAAFSGVSITTLKYGVGTHQWNVPISNFTSVVLRLFIAVDLLYSPSIMLAKLSLLVLYLQVFQPKAVMRYLIYSGMALTISFYTATTIAYGVLTIPRPGQTLIQAILSSNTAQDIPLSVVQAAFNIVTDFYILCIPIIGVWPLQFSTRKKIAVSAIFFTGLFACLASVAGLYYRTKLNRSSDLTWNLIPILVWVIVELTVGVMCGCMPAFAAFLRYHRIPFNDLVKALASSFRKPSFKSSSGGSSSRKLATRDLRMTLGSRVDGRGHFLNPTSVFAHEEHRVELGEGKARGHVAPETGLEENDTMQIPRPTFRCTDQGETHTHIRSSYAPETYVERDPSAPGIRVENEMQTVWS